MPRIARTFATSTACCFALTAAALASQGPGVGAGPTSLLTEVAGTAILGALMAVVAVGLGKLASRRLDAHPARRMRGDRGLDWQS
jgi:hypothetical protein